MSVKNKENSKQIKLKKLFFLILSFYSLSSFALVKRDVTYKYSELPLPPSAKIYEKWGMEINPFIKAPFNTLNDKAVNSEKKILYDVTYTTNNLGLRNVLNTNLKGKNHLIYGGDSYAFGVGSNDNETIAFHLAEKFTDTTVINFGLSGTGPHSMLRFLDFFDFKDIAPANYKKGIFIYDWFPHLTNRVIGSKSFLKWGELTPRYELNKENTPTYMGNFTDTAQFKLYKQLYKLPYSDELFPDLPRIGEEHIELAVQIILSIKNKYLEQTSPDNKFFVSIDPLNGGKDGIKNNEVAVNELRIFKRKLAEHKIDILSFTEEEKLEMPVHSGEFHFKPEANKNYAQMLYLKIKDKF